MSDPLAYLNQLEEDIEEDEQMDALLQGGRTTTTTTTTTAPSTTSTGNDGEGDEIDLLSNDDHPHHHHHHGNHHKPPPPDAAPSVSDIISVRNAKRLSSGPPSKPLPLPSTSRSVIEKASPVAPPQRGYYSVLETSPTATRGSRAESLAPPTEPAPPPPRARPSKALRGSDVLPPAAKQASPSLSLNVRGMRTGSDDQGSASPRAERVGLGGNLSPRSSERTSPRTSERRSSPRSSLVAGTPSKAPDRGASSHLSAVLSSKSPRDSSSPAVRRNQTSPRKAAGAEDSFLDDDDDDSDGQYELTSPRTSAPSNSKRFTRAPGSAIEDIPSQGGFVKAQPSEWAKAVASGTSSEVGSVIEDEGSGGGQGKLSPGRSSTPNNHLSVRASMSPKVAPRGANAQLRASGTNPSGGSVRGGLPTSPKDAFDPMTRTVREIAALLRRAVPMQEVILDANQTYDNCFSGADVVETMMANRKGMSKQEAILMGSKLLQNGYIVKVGFQSGGFRGEDQEFYRHNVMPDLAAPRGSASLDAETLRAALKDVDTAPTKPLDVRGMTVEIIGYRVRFDYQAEAPFVEYFLHINVATEGVWTVSRRFRDFLSMQKSLLKRYAARLLPKLPSKEDSKDLSATRAALQVYLTGLIDCRFLADQAEFVQFFRDFSKDLNPLLVNRAEFLPLGEAFLLLGPSITSPQLRAEAVKRLRQEDSHSLVTYILFLVSALRYEAASAKSPLLVFLLETAALENEFAVLLYWHLTVERRAENSLPIYAVALKLLEERLSPELNRTLATQTTMIAKLTEVVQSVAASKRDRLEKIERLRAMLSGSVGSALRVCDPPVLFPITPRLKTTGCVAETATLYKSALLPLGLEWRVVAADEDVDVEAQRRNVVVHPDGSLTKRIIFKAGDDLRQDQMVTAFIDLIAGIFRTEGLDMRMCTYHVLATGAAEGLIEVVPSAHNVAHILETYSAQEGGIQMFFMKHNRKVAQHAEAVDNYVRSCAGYSVVTYFLGVGDRHLDNILLTEDGKLFHVDFGFILGADPKPLPPLVRLTKEMVEGMGGFHSGGYEQFLGHCVSCFRILRRYSPLLLALFSLVGDALSGISNQTALPFLYQRLRLDLDDDQASGYLKQIINESVSSLFPQLMEKIHSSAQKGRK